MATEKLKFRLELHATMWNKPPHAEILINDHTCYKGDITGSEDNPDVIEFEHEATEGEKYNLIIKRSGKGKYETILNDKGDILNTTTFSPFLKVKYILGYAANSWKLVDYVSGM